MLLEFRFQNFLSYRNETVFNMLASGTETDSRHLIDIDGSKLLRCAALYGANASGKSNFIKAMDFARKVIVSTAKSGKKYDLPYFKLDNSCSEQPTMFRFVFQAKQRIYEYGFRLTADRIVEEWLYWQDRNKEKPLFERITDSAGKTEVTIFPALARAGKNKERMNLLADNIGPKQKNQLFLTKLYENNVDRVEPVVEWFQQLTIIYPESRYGVLEIRAHADNDFHLSLSKMVATLDTSIEGLKLDKRQLDIQKEFGHLSDEMKEGLIEAIDDMDEKTLISFSINHNRYHIIQEEDKKYILKLRSQHTNADGERILFDINEESDGTQRLLDLIPAFLELTNRDQVYIIDEMDRSLHTLLLTNVLEYFFKAMSKNSQLIFTTHDTNAMNVLRNDEMWMVDKNKDNMSSEIYSLTDFDIKGDLNIIKGYLNGRFGGVPLLTALQRVDNRGEQAYHE